MARKQSLIINILGNNKVGRAVRDATRALQGLGRAAARIGRGMVKAFKATAVTIGGLAAGISAVTVRTAKFNVAMARAWTMTDGGMAVFRAMREEVMQLSGELGVAKDELSNGLYQALSAGVPRDNVFEFLRIAAKTAVADGSDIATAVDGITTIINAFGLSAEDAGMVTDKMFATVRGGKTSFGQLADNMSKSAATASSLGVSIDELLAAVMTLTKQGTPTDVALTSLRNIMLSLNGELGDGWAESMTLQDALGKVADSAGMSATALESIFGKRDITQVFALVGKNAAAASKDLNTMRDSTGDLQVAFGKVQQFRIFERLANVLSTVANRFGIAVAEGMDLEQTINTIADRVEEMGKDYADAILPHIKKVKAAVDDMISGDPERVERGKKAITDMLDGALDAVRPTFESMGEAIGAAIVRGVKDGISNLRRSMPQLIPDPFADGGPRAKGRALRERLNSEASANPPVVSDGGFRARGRELRERLAGGDRVAPPVSFPSLRATLSDGGQLSPSFMPGVSHVRAGTQPGSSPSTPLHVMEVNPNGIIQ